MRRVLILALGLSIALAAIQPRPAHAIDSDVRSVLVGGLYGMVGGTVLGLAAMPFTGTPRSIFQGTSIGLYLGLAVGFYYIWNRNDPGNPLNYEHAPNYTPQDRLREDRPGYYNYRYTPEGDAVVGASLVAARF